MCLDDHSLYVIGLGLYVAFVLSRTVIIIVIKNNNTVSGQKGSKPTKQAIYINL